MSQNQNNQIATSDQSDAWQLGKHSVLFSDECFLKKGKIGNFCLWFNSRDEIQDEHCYEKEKYPKLQIHIWGITAMRNPSTQNNDMEDGYLNAKLFITIKYGFMSLKQIYKRFLIAKSIQSINWPSKGVDLSPIERIQGYLKEEMNEMDDEISSEQLFQNLETIFINSKKIKLSIKRLFESLPQKILQVIQKQGDQINI
ncbi:hypothetical protein ABPG72_012142 [Tetrahymena utriculariae]